MPRTRNLGQLRADVRSRVDQVSSPYIPDSELNEWINKAWAEVYDLLTETGQKYYLNTAVFYTQAGQDTYALPCDHYKTLGVDAQVNGAEWTPVHRYQFEQRNDYNQSTGDWATPTGSVLYDLRAGFLHFIPAPPQVMQMKHYYFPVAARMTSDTSSIDGVNGFEDYAVDYAAKKAAQRGEEWELVQSLENDMALQRARIKAMADDRIAGEAPKARVSRGRITVPGTYPIWRRW